MTGRVELVFGSDPGPGDTGRELTVVRQYAVSLLHGFADDAVVLLDDRQHGVVLDFAAFHNDTAGDVFVAQGVLHGRHFGCIVVVYVFGQEVDPQPNLPEKFINCHNVCCLVR